MASSAPRAVVLLSGGLDSATVLAVARSRGFGCCALTFDYGQRHLAEIEAAERVARSLGVREHKIARIDLRLFGGSALTADIDVPKDRTLDRGAGEIPVTYVPARNTIFLSFALGYAEVVAAGDIFIGVNAVDFSGYPDCRPEYLRAFQTMANLATRAGVNGRGPTIQAPLIDMSKAEIIRKGLELGVDFGLTLSCYDPISDGNFGCRPCGHCDACRLRAAGFHEAGLPDPLAPGAPMRNPMPRPGL
jgi:7-cyano-7-deazaguanine synthase